MVWHFGVQSTGPRHLKMVLARSRYEKNAHPSRDCSNRAAPAKDFIYPYRWDQKLKVLLQ